MLVGYMRVSKADGSQTLDLQRDALLVAGVDPDRLYEDLASGRRDDRPGLTACLKALRKGDTLVVWKLDRLGRNLHHLVNIVHDLTARDVGLKVLTGQGAAIDTTTAAGKLVFGILAIIQATGCLSAEASQPQAGFAAPFPATSQSDVAASQRYVRCRVSKSVVGCREQRTPPDRHERDAHGAPAAACCGAWRSLTPASERAA